jgi:hypothetical protein
MGDLSDAFGFDQEVSFHSTDGTMLTSTLGEIISKIIRSNVMSILRSEGVHVNRAVVSEVEDLVVEYDKDNITTQDIQKALQKMSIYLSKNGLRKLLTSTLVNKNYGKNEKFERSKFKILADFDLDKVIAEDFLHKPIDSAFYDLLSEHIPPKINFLTGVTAIRSMAKGLVSQKAYGVFLERAKRLAEQEGFNIIVPVGDTPSFDVVVTDDNAVDPLVIKFQLRDGNRMIADISYTLFRDRPFEVGITWR